MDSKNLKDELDEYLTSDKSDKIKVEVEKELVIAPRTGLVERVDRTLVVPDGRQLLTEIY